MVIRVSKIRFWFLLIMLLGMTILATSMPLPSHLTSSIIEHHHCDESDTPESSKKHVPQHDCEKCAVCKILIGASGKCLVQEADSVILYFDQSFPITHIVSKYVDTHKFSTSVPRGPPLS